MLGRKWAENAQPNVKGSISSFAVSRTSPGGAGMGLQRDESFHLLLELSNQEPTMQACFKIIESTCLARGIDMEIAGRPPSPEFRNFICRYYTPFVENAIRCETCMFDAA